MSQQINLFNPVFLKQKKMFSAVNMLDALAVLLVGVAVFYAYAKIETLNLDRQAVETGRQYDQAKTRLAQTSARYAPRIADPVLAAEAVKLQAQLGARKAALDGMGMGAIAPEAGYAEYLRALARQSLAGLWLTAFKIAKGGAELEITGRALQPELVPTYIRGLNRERAMQGRAFESLSMTQRQAALPADPSRPDSTSARYVYTEFRFGTSHGELPLEADAEPAAKPAPEAQGETATMPQAQAGSAAAK